MEDKRKTSRSVRWVLSVLIVAAGLTTAWAWGRVASLAEPAAPAPVRAAPVLYAAWQPMGAPQLLLFRSSDDGASWEPVALPDRGVPVAWAGDAGNRVAVGLSDGQILRSEDWGATWTPVAARLSVSSLAWDGQGSLYLGSKDGGVYRLAASGELEQVLIGQPGLSEPVSRLAIAGGRLFAAAASSLFSTDDGGLTWSAAQAAPGRISALAAVDAQTVYVGIETAGVFRSQDGGASWQPASTGLGQAAGLYLAVTALQADPAEAGVVYASVSYITGSTQVHATAMGSFVTVDGGRSWVPLAGPGYPQARAGTALLVAPGKPLRVGSLAQDGLQSYAADTAAALATLEGDDDAIARATAARILGLAQAQGASDALLAAVRSPDPAVSMAAGEALGRIADPATVAPLLEDVSSGGQVLRSAAIALGLMRAEQAVAPLSDALLQGEPALTGVAAEALGRIGSHDAVQALLAVLADAKLTPRRHAALGALEAMGERAVAPVEAMLTSSDATSRANAAEALGWIGSQSAEATLARALVDSDSAVRAQAAWALGELTAPQARDTLERAQAGDPSSLVRQAAGAALTRLPQEVTVRSTLLARWAPALSQWEMVRWAIPVLSLLVAAWLVIGDRRRAMVPAPQRVRRHS